MDLQRYALGLIGFPLEHSLSPALHHAALRALELEGEYHLYPVPPLPDGRQQLGELLGKLRDGDLHGLNVTIPHKRSVLPFLDRLTVQAAGIGAVNTVIRDGNNLVGDNTDAGGFLADLRRLGWISGEDFPAGEEQSGIALVLGAGGAARAVAYALARAGWTVSVAARRPEKATGLADEMVKALEGGMISRPKVRALPLGSPGLLLDPPPHLIVNATPVGMGRDQDSSPWPAGLPFPPGACLYDLVYYPDETALVRQARRAGLRSSGGLGMLVEQAALAFTAWTGRPAPLEVMRRVAGSPSSRE